MSDPEALGTRLRHVLELLEGDVARVYVEQGLGWYRPRFSAFLRHLAVSGPCAIRDLAVAVGVTHSAASQTVAQLRRDELVTLAAGEDARQRIVALTDRARDLLPVVNAEWTATAAAAAGLEAELPYPLTGVLAALEEALARKPFHQRIAEQSPSPNE
ncbi:MarR family transcriptional regulator [Actinokineospora sp. NBRC 105648]|uniref:MarR family winged helix-turn-helix transcriptional regulator n=1 Tax=Actinokineospora sp. NBRC 105648 TaxID=3032206 RepID=UPI0024A19FF1|nr:MarR family transcriptional regulator [Actinokineospora sp. NBRC 105648]GLZ43206.1 MarR family transcriptional regulator [Actinokineospora sp. NBRC 105648]